MGRHISILHRYWQIYMDRVLAPLGIGAGQLPILLFLLKNDGVKQAEVVRHLRTDKGATARTILKLVEHGYLERLPDPDDGRAYEIHTTAKAQAAQSELQTILSGWTEAVSQDLSADERALLFDLLGRMLTRADELVKPGSPSSDEGVAR